METFYLFVALLLSNFSTLLAFNYNISLEEIIQGECRLVAPRVCKQITNEPNPDYTCGFIFRDVCSGFYRHHRTKRSDSQQMDENSQLHVTPLPKNMKFYDGNQDGLLTLNEFARTLGHNPRARHVRAAFKAVDRNGNGKIDKREFKNNVWIFDDGFTDQDYGLIEAPVGSVPTDTKFDQDLVPTDDSDQMDPANPQEYNYYDPSSDDADMGGGSGGSGGDSGSGDSGSGGGSGSDSSSSEEDSSGSGGSDSGSGSGGDSGSGSGGDSGSGSGSGGDSGSGSGSGGDSGSGSGGSGSGSGGDSGSGSGGSGSGSGSGSGQKESSEETPDASGSGGQGGMGGEGTGGPGNTGADKTDDSTENYPDYPGVTDKPMLDIPKALGMGRNKEDDEGGRGPDMMDMAFIQSALNAMKNARRDGRTRPRDRNMEAAPRRGGERYPENNLYPDPNRRKEYPTPPPNVMGDMMGITPPYDVNTKGREAPMGRRGNGRMGDERSGMGRMGDERSGTGRMGDERSGTGRMGDERSGMGRMGDERSGMGGMGADGAGTESSGRGSRIRTRDPSTAARG